MIMVGAIMAIGTGNYDVTSMFAGLGLPFVAMLVLILATWTTNTGNAYICLLYTSDTQPALMQTRILSLLITYIGA